MKAIRSTDTQLVYQLNGIGLVTSLPYLDPSLDKQEYRQVKKLILEECERGGPLEDVQFDEVDTPMLDALETDQLGKRHDYERDKSQVSRSEYEKAVIEVEQMKER